MEFVNHLGLGHMLMEPIVVAFSNWEYTANNEKNALIRKMLRPHTDRTLTINFLAKNTLLSNNESVSLDSSFSTGRKLEPTAFKTLIKRIVRTI